jgi:2-iminobutanoate/2-iminopropanoate deaminase
LYPPPPPSFPVSRTIISTDKAPGAVGPYSQAVVTNGLAFISGQVALVPGTKDLKAGGVAEQARQCLTNLSAILAAAGSSPAHVVKTTVLLADMADFGAVNAVYAEFFPADPPARACFAVKELPLGALVEIEAVAVVP